MPDELRTAPLPPTEAEVAESRIAAWLAANADCPDRVISEGPGTIEAVGNGPELRLFDIKSIIDDWRRMWEPLSGDVADMLRVAEQELRRPKDDGSTPGLDNKIAWQILGMARLGLRERDALRVLAGELADIGRRLAGACAGNHYHSMENVQQSTCIQCNTVKEMRAALAHAAERGVGK